MRGYKRRPFRSSFIDNLWYLNSILLRHIIRATKPTIKAFTLYITVRRDRENLYGACIAISTFQKVHILPISMSLVFQFCLNLYYKVNDVLNELKPYPCYFE